MIYKSFTSQRCFGVELETSQTLSQKEIASLVARSSNRGVTVMQHANSKGNRKWHVKTDASCGDATTNEGWEIASYKGSGVHDLLDISCTAQKLRDHGLRVNNFCGLHVHCEVNDFWPHRIGYLLARWVAIEPWLFNAVPYRRSSSDYCKSLQEVRWLDVGVSRTPWQLWEYFKPEYEVYKSHDYRRVSLNLCNFYMEKNLSKKKRCTVELRLPEGSLRGVDVKNWIRFFVHLVETSAQDNRLFPLQALTLDDFFNGCGFGHDGEFSILSPGLRETKLWFLKRLRKYHFNLRGTNRQEIDDYLYRMTWPEKLVI